MRGFSEAGSWDLIGSMGMSFNLFGHTPGGAHLPTGQAGGGRAGGRGAAGAPHAMDVNRTRILLLHLAEFLGLLPQTLTGPTRRPDNSGRGTENKDKGPPFPVTTDTTTTPLTLRELLLSGWTVDLLLQHVRESRIPVRRSDLIDAAIAIGEVHGHMAARALCDRLLAQDALVLVTDLHRGSSNKDRDKDRDRDKGSTVASSTVPRHVADLIHTEQQPQLPETRSQRARQDVKAALDTDSTGGGRMSLVGGDYFADSIDDSDCDGASDDEEEEDEEEDNREGGEGWRTEHGFPVRAPGGAGREARGTRGGVRQSDDATASSSSRQLPMNHASSMSLSSSSMMMQVEEQTATASPTQPMYLLQAPSLLAADEQGPGLAQASLPGGSGKLGLGGVGKMHRRVESSGGAGTGTGAVRGITIYLPNTSHQFKSPPPQHPQYIQQLHESRERKKKSSSTSSFSSLPSSSSSSSSLRDHGLSASGETASLHEEIGPGPWLRAWIRSCRQSIEQAWVGAETGRGTGADDAAAFSKGNTSTNSSSSSSSFVVNGRVSFNPPATAAAAAINDDSESVLKQAPAPAVTMQSFKVIKDAPYHTNTTHQPLSIPSPPPLPHYR